MKLSQGLLLKSNNICEIFDYCIVNTKLNIFNLNFYELEINFGCIKHFVQFCIYHHKHFTNYLIE